MLVASSEGCGAIFVGAYRFGVRALLVFIRVEMSLGYLAWT